MEISFLGWALVPERVLGCLLLVLMVEFFEIDVGNCSGTFFILFSEVLGDLFRFVWRSPLLLGGD